MPNPTRAFVVLWLAAASYPSPGRTQTAYRDTIPNAVGIVEPIIVEGKEFTVRDVVRRAMQGERTKLGNHRDATYRITTHVAIVWPEKKTVETEIYQVYGDSTGYMRRVLVAAQSEKFKKENGEWVFDKSGDPDTEYRIKDYDTSRFTSIPVYLENDEEFNFTLLDRVLEADRVIFHVAFKPKSEFSEMPLGEIWIDSKGFRVIHEIYDFNANPMPMLIKGVRRVSLQWTQLAGGEWVPKRLAGEMDIRRGLAWFAPSGVSFMQTWDDFRFDPGYDDRLLGETDRTRELGTGPIVESSDTTLTPGTPQLLATLQEEDDSLFTPEVRITNYAFIDSTTALYDSIGVSGLAEYGPLYGDSWKLDFGPGASMWDYNRVEGLVFGGQVHFGRADEHTRLSGFGGYATAPEKFRYKVDFNTALPKTDRKASLVASFRDRVEPFGSNRPAFNGLRALVGGADEQDYVHRLGGSARVVVTPAEELSFDAGFEAVRERAVATDEDFSVFGNMNQPNPAVEEGDERAIVVGARVNAPHWLDASITQRSAGGALGGDFRYHRTDISLRARGFVLGRQELDLMLNGVATGDAPPFQQLADVGGLSTVRGYDRRTHVGNHSFAARLEYLVPYDVFGATQIPLLEDSNIQFIPWADAGRVGEGDSQDWITSAGIGLQRYLWPIENAGNLRLDFAFPFDHPSDDFVVYLWFVALR